MKAKDVTWLIRLKVFLEIFVPKLNKVILYQRELKLMRWSIRYELVFIDWLEDITEDLEISTDPEIISLMEEAGQNLSPADVL